ncbi:Pentatricopeptide repeat-containing protein, mitochondrial, partial [Mucuna pruriens]
MMIVDEFEEWRKKKCFFFPRGFSSSSPHQKQSPTHFLSLHKSLISNNTDEAWESFKAITVHYFFPPKPLIHFSSLGDTLNLKEGLCSSSWRAANTVVPAFALVMCMLRNRVALKERIEFMKPDVGACNAALEGCCCCELESVSDAEKSSSSIDSCVCKRLQQKDLQQQWKQ